MKCGKFGVITYSDDNIEVSFKSENPELTQ